MPFSSVGLNSKLQALLKNRLEPWYHCTSWTINRWKMSKFTWENKKWKNAFLKPHAGAILSSWGATDGFWQFHSICKTESFCMKFQESYELYSGFDEDFLMKCYELDIAMLPAMLTANLSGLHLERTGCLSQGNHAIWGIEELYTVSGFTFVVGSHPSP